MSEAKPRKPKKLKETIVEKRLKEGANVMRTLSQDGALWAFTDSGRTARADVCARLLTAGKMRPLGDCLFPEDSQTYGLA